MPTFKRKRPSVSMSRKRIKPYNPFFDPANFAKGHTSAKNVRTGGLIGLESKFLDTGKTAFTIPAPTDSTGGVVPLTVPSAIGCLTAPAQGSSSSERDGRQIIITSMQFHGNVYTDVQANQSTADPMPAVYIALVQDTQTNGVAFASDDVYDNISVQAQTAAQPFKLMSNATRFKILKWKRIQIPMAAITNESGATGKVIQSATQVPVNMFWKGKMKVNFTTGASTASVANVIDNSVNVVAFCSHASGVAPKLSFGCRTRFYG